MSRTFALLFSVALLSVGCGGSAPPPADPVETEPTAGGDARPEPAARMQSTQPAPLPSSAVDRAEFSEPLQAVWTTIEENVEMQAPEGEASEQVFTTWIGTRTEGVGRAVSQSEPVTESPAYERALVAALIGYGLEDLIASARTAPVSEAMATTLEPLAVQAVTYYAYCERRLSALGDGSNWAAWRDYCAQRGQAMIEIYGLEAPSPAAY